MEKELPDDIYAEVTRLSTAGNELSDRGDYVGAVEKFEQALALLPPPADDWSAAMWLYTSVGDCSYRACDYERARIALNHAQYFDESLDNPFIWLRRGQVYYEIGDTKLADDCLASAYMLGGNEIFDGEDPKYAEYILSKLDLPANAEPADPGNHEGRGR